MSLCVLKTHTKMLLLKCGAIRELYVILRVYFGRKCFSLFITPNLRDILVAILSIIPIPVQCFMYCNSWGNKLPNAFNMLTA